VEKSKKQYVDSQVIRQEEAKREQEEHKRFGTTGAKELMKAGGIKEAAVVFSHEGMNAFATMFANSTEASVQKALSNLEPMIERIIEQKLIEMLEGATQGIQEFLASSMQVSAEKQVQGVMEGLLEKTEKQPIKRPKKDKPIKARTKLKNSEIILSVLQEAGKELTVNEISKIAEEKYGKKWNNPSSPILYATQRYPDNIINISYGLYMYKGENS